MKGRKTGKTKGFSVGPSTRKAIGENLGKTQLEASSPLFPSRKEHQSIGREQAYRELNKTARAVGIKDKIGTHTMSIVGPEK